MNGRLRLSGPSSCSSCSPSAASNQILGDGRLFKRSCFSMKLLIFLGGPKFFLQAPIKARKPRRPVLIPPPSWRSRIFITALKSQDLPSWKRRRKRVLKRLVSLHFAMLPRQITFWRIPLPPCGPSPVCGDVNPGNLGVLETQRSTKLNQVAVKPTSWR